MTKFELHVLGTGAGASMIYHGLTSTSFMLLQDEQPICLIDLGLGVGRKVIEAFGGFPKNIIVTHNHSDHAADLPVVLRVEEAQGKRCRVIVQKEVAERLQKFRLSEHSQVKDPLELADWVSIDSEVKTAINDVLDIEFFPAEHSELCFGFMLYYKGKPMLSYTADSTLYLPLYEVLDQAPYFIIDARHKQNSWHANFDEVIPWLKSGRFIAGHGLSLEEIELYSDLPLLKEGERLVLNVDVD